MAPPDPEKPATLTTEELARTIEKSPRSTIEPVSASDVPGRLALAGLGAERDQHAVTRGLTIEQTIGEGGMGIVRMATQRSLGRKVAVKTLRPEVRSERATLHLLREAWVTGSLEHPNIVPVYDLGLGEDGSPIIVLKKIEGTTWESLLQDGGGEGRLEQNLRILVQLCNAVELAHARGILHRDLKPDNVMIGSFGEVYLVDWGIAVSLREDPTGRLPYVQPAGNEIAGTPSYMAPEMLNRGELTERTDVYLLGAVLHELLTGAPPHTGNFAQIVASIHQSEPVYGPDVPPELAAIATKAMSREPAARFASAQELRQRLERYLEQRGSLALSMAASRGLAQMEEAVAKGAPRDEVYRLFAESRFGFRHALAESPDNDAARRGLRTAIEAMIAYELDRGTPEAAAAALAELETPPPSLALRVSEAQESATRERARLARLEAEHDPRTGRRSRVFATLMLGVVWIVTPQLGPWLEGRFATLAYGSMVLTGLMLLVAIAVGRWGDASFRRTAFNRRARSALYVTFGAMLLLELGTMMLGLPTATSIVLHMFVFTTATAFMAALIEPKVWPAVLGYAAGFLACCADPSLRWRAATLTNTALIMNLVYAWATIEGAKSWLSRVRGRREG